MSKVSQRELCIEAEMFYRQPYRFAFMMQQKLLGILEHLPPPGPMGREASQAGWVSCQQGVKVADQIAGQSATASPA